MNEDIKRLIIVRDILIPSLQRLYDIDYDNIRFGVSERNICARLAHHMENILRDYDNSHNNGNIFRNYFVDVEYNRMGNGDIKRYENSAHLPQNMVSDLLIQSRGVERNLLAVEMKRKRNYKKVKDDKDRLKSMVSSQAYCEIPTVHDTLVGAFIVYSPEDVKIEFFRDIRERGESVCQIRCTYREGMLSIPNMEFVGLMQNPD